MVEPLLCSVRRRTKPTTVDLYEVFCSAQCCTRHYTPRTNGKAQRFIQTLLREWSYAFIYPNSDARASELAPWMFHYNFHRPHSATAHRPPASRLRLDGNNVVRNYS